MGRPRIDLTGQRFGSWTVLALVPHEPGAPVYWLCGCDCGAEDKVFGANLRRGRSTRCAACANQAKRIDLVGMTYGRWTVLADAGRNVGGDRLFLCRCECGKEQVIVMSNLTCGRSTQCRSCANRNRTSN